MEKKNKVGRPRKEKKFKRDKSFLLKMRVDEYEKINKLFLIAESKFKASSLNDFIIKSATGEIKYSW